MARPSSSTTGPISAAGPGRPVLIRLDPGHDLVQVVEGLDARAQGLRRDAPVARSDEPKAVLVLLLRIQRNRWLRDDHDRRAPLALPWVEPEVPRAAGHDRSDVPVDEVVPTARLDDELGELLLRARDPEVDRLRALVHPLDVALELEDPPVVCPDPLENAVPVQKSVVENRHLCVGGWVKLAVNVDDLFQAGDPQLHLVSSVRDIGFAYTVTNIDYRNRCPVRRSNREI